MVRSDEEPAPLAPGAIAPEFTLRSTPEQEVSLSDFRGQPVVLVFYPADWSPVCTDELVLYQELMPELKKHGAQVLGISCDGVWCHLAFAKDRHLRFPLLSDFHPKGAVSKQYQAYVESQGVSSRSLFVIDPDGTIAWSYRSPIGVNPGVDGVLRALEEISDRRSKGRKSDEPDSQVRVGGQPDRPGFA
jgi:peroxiredoxin